MSMDEDVVAVQKKFQLFSFLIKTKVVQNVNRMTERQANRQIEDKTTFQPRYQNKSCLECQLDDRQTNRQIERLNNFSG